MDNQDKQNEQLADVVESSSIEEVYTGPIYADSKIGEALKNSILQKKSELNFISPKQTVKTEPAIIQPNFLQRMADSFAANKAAKKAANKAVAPKPQNSNQMPLDQALSMSIIRETKDKKIIANNYVWSKSRAGVVIAVLILIFLGLYGGYQWGKHHTHNSDVAEYDAAGLHPQGGAIGIALSTSPSIGTAASTTVPENQSKPIIPENPLQNPLRPRTVSRPTQVSRPVIAQAQLLTATFDYPAASISISTPRNWVILQSENNGTVLDLFDGINTHGEIIIAANVQESLQQERLELQANQSVSNITDIAFHGIPALMYTTAGSQSANVILEYKGSIYNFNQGAANEVGGYSVWFH